MEGAGQRIEGRVEASCSVPVPPDRPLLVHVSATGSNVWDENPGKGKPFWFTRLLDWLGISTLSPCHTKRLDTLRVPNS